MDTSTERGLTSPLSRTAADVNRDRSYALSPQYRAVISVSMGNASARIVFLHGRKWRPRVHRAVPTPDARGARRAGAQPPRSPLCWMALQSLGPELGLVFPDWDPSSNMETNVTTMVRTAPTLVRCSYLPAQPLTIVSTYSGCCQSLHHREILIKKIFLVEVSMKKREQRSCRNLNPQKLS